MHAEGRALSPKAPTFLFLSFPNHSWALLASISRALPPQSLALILAAGSATTNEVMMLLGGLDDTWNQV